MLNYRQGQEEKDSFKWLEFIIKRENVAYSYTTVVADLEKQPIGKWEFQKNGSEYPVRCLYGR